MGAWPPSLRPAGTARSPRGPGHDPALGGPRRAARAASEGSRQVPSHGAQRRRAAGGPAPGHPERGPRSPARLVAVSPAPAGVPDSTAVNGVPGSARPPGGRNKASQARAAGDWRGRRDFGNAWSSCSSFMGRGSEESALSRLNLYSRVCTLNVIHDQGPRWFQSNPFSPKLSKSRGRSDIGP